MKDKSAKSVYTLVYVLGFSYIGFRSSQISIAKYDGFPFLVMAITVATVIIHYLIQIVLHEAGHLVAGLLSGYQFVYFRIGSFVWVKNAQQKIEIKKMKINGTGGQCVMCPTEFDPEKCPYILYQAMGGLVNIIVGILAIVAAIMLPHNLITFCLCEEFGVIGIVIGLSNLIPSKVKGIQNDGYNLLDLRKDPVARKCFHLILALNGSMVVADSYDDLPENIVTELKAMDFTQLDISNSPIGNAFSFQAGIYYMEGNYEKSYELQKQIAQSAEILPLFKKEAMCQCLFFELLNGEPKEVIEQRYDSELKNYIQATMIYPSRQRLMYTYYKLYEKNNEKAEACKRKLEGMRETFYIRADVEHELEVIQQLECN